MKYYILWVTPDGSHLWAGPYERAEISDVVSHLAEDPQEILILPGRGKREDMEQEEVPQSGPQPHEPVYRMGDDLVPQSGMRKWHNDRGLPWSEAFDGPEPVTMGRMARSVLGNPSLHYYNEHGGPDVPFEQVAVAHLMAHVYGRFRKGQAHYHEAPPEDENHGMLPGRRRPGPGSPRCRGRR